MASSESPTSLALSEEKRAIRVFHSPECVRARLCILHYGSIVVSRHARIGENCTLNSAVNIGVSPTSPGAPHIGNGVYIGPGAKLWNDITIADGVTIGANACVSKSVTEEGAVVVGTNRVL